MKISDVSEYLSDHNIKPSYQRIRILEYLLKYKNHPTVDTIYSALVKEIHILSKTTVYNTLKLFAEKGIVLIINIEDNETRFDASTSLHGHFKCTRCVKVFDFDVNLTDLNFEKIEDFEINETHVYLKGVCKKCKS